MIEPLTLASRQAAGRQSEWDSQSDPVSVTRAIRVIRVPLIGDLLSN